ncbi:MAG: 30S ribosome-binding factor RbfA [Pseudomonadota bacterium]
MSRSAHTGGQGPSQRQLRVGELIRRALSGVLARGELFDPALERTSITVGEVRTTPDLRNATVYVLPLGGTGADEAVEALNTHRGELRRLVTKAVTLKFSPQLNFVIDTSFDQMDETRRLLSDPVIRRDVAGDKGDGAP